jgi:hypothetical protein
MAIITKTSLSPDTVILTAGENLSQYDYVFIAHPTAGYTFLDGSVAGQAYKVRKDIRTRGADAMCVGFATAAASAGNPVSVKTKGYLSGQSGLTAGRVYQPSATPGAIELFDGLKNYHPNIVGVAISTTELLIYEQVWRQRGRGFLVAGYTSGNANTIESFSFSNLTSYALPVLGQSKKYPGCTSTYHKVYASGGGDGGSTYYAPIYYIMLANDTNATPTNLTIGRTFLTASYSSTKSYCYGGNTGSSRDVVDALTFSSETCANTTTLSQARYGIVSLSSALKNYNFGGNTGSATVTTTDALTISSETVASISSPLGTAKWLTGGGASNTKAYIGGGYTTTSNTSSTNALTQFSFSTETNATLTTFSNQARGELGGMASFTKAYFAGGYNPSSAVSVVDELPFSTETCAKSFSLLSIRCSYDGVQV